MLGQTEARRKASTLMVGGWLGMAEAMVPGIISSAFDRHIPPPSKPKTEEEILADKGALANAEAKRKRKMERRRKL